MIYPIGPGVPDLSSTGPSGITPAIWVKPFIKKNNAVSAYYEIADTDIDVQEGDVFVMSTILPVTVTDDLPAGATITREMPQFPRIELHIDKNETFGMNFLNAQIRQANKDYMAAQSSQAAVDVQNRIDVRVLGTIINDVDASNTGATAGAQFASYNIGGVAAPVQFTSTNAVEYLTMCNAVLDEQEAPQEGRFIIINPTMNQKLLNSDLSVASKMGGGDQSILRGNGRLPFPVANLSVYVNSHLPTVTEANSTKCIQPIFGVKGSFVFGQQLREFEEKKAENFFGWHVDGQEAFGFKVVNGKNLGFGEVYF